MDFKNWFTVGLLLFFLLVGFFIGRFTSNKEVVRYIKGDTVRDSIFIPPPISSETPAEPLLPKKRDTIYIENTEYITEKVDTSAIIADYIQLRTYDFKVFDNESGRLDITQKIGYNKLLKFDYKFTPIIKTVTLQKENVFIPFVSTSYNTLHHVGAGGGLFIKDLGFEYLYNIDLKHEVGNYHTFGLKYKF